MPLQIIHQDITKVKCDAIVDPTNRYLLGSGGADRAIHMAAGEELDKVCSHAEPLAIGEVRVTPGFELPCRYILHTRGPVWYGGGRNETQMLRSCYINCLFEAGKLGLTSIAFPLISSGAHSFPKDKVLRIAIDAISDYLLAAEKELDVSICIIDRYSYEIGRRIALEQYLERNTARPSCAAPQRAELEDCCMESMPMAAGRASARRTGNAKYAKGAATVQGEDLAQWLKKKDDGFCIKLLRLIDEKGMGDVECYKKANVSKNTFSKIKNSDPKNPYKPSKPTVIAFAVALELNVEETDALLRSAGFSLSHSSMFDMVIEFYISSGIYDIFEINSALYQYDLPCLGC